MTPNNFREKANFIWQVADDTHRVRTAPIVPLDYYANSIAKLEAKTKLTVIGGPACAHNGTWWQVSPQKGQVGWVRKHISTGYLIAH